MRTRQSYPFLSGPAPRHRSPPEGPGWSPLESGSAPRSQPRAGLAAPLREGPDRGNQGNQPRSRPQSLAQEHLGGSRSLLQGTRSGAAAGGHCSRFAVILPKQVGASRIRFRCSRAKRKLRQFSLTSGAETRRTALSGGLLTHLNERTASRSCRAILHGAEEVAAAGGLTGLRQISHTTPLALGYRAGRATHCRACGIALVKWSKVRISGCEEPG